jgi:hypothetical protein
VRGEHELFAASGSGDLGPAPGARLEEHIELAALRSEMHDEVTEAISVEVGGELKLAAVA